MMSRPRDAPQSPSVRFYSTDHRPELRQLTLPCPWYPWEKRRFVGSYEAPAAGAAIIPSTTPALRWVAPSPRRTTSRSRSSPLAIEVPSALTRRTVFELDPRHHSAQGSRGFARSASWTVRSSVWELMQKTISGSGRSRRRAVTWDQLGGRGVPDADVGYASAGGFLAVVLRVAGFSDDGTSAPTWDAAHWAGARGADRARLSASTSSWNRTGPREPSG